MKATNVENPMSKKMMKEQEKAAELARRDQLDKIPLFKQWNKQELELGFVQLELILATAISKGQFDTVEFNNLI